MIEKKLEWIRKLVDKRSFIKLQHNGGVTVSGVAQFEEGTVVVMIYPCGAYLSVVDLSDIMARIRGKIEPYCELAVEIGIAAAD